MRLVLVILAIVLLAAGCGKYSDTPVANLRYVKDAHTGLCFVSYRTSYNYTALTCVPCDSLHHVVVEDLK